MKLLDRLGITGWEDRDRRGEMSYFDYLCGEAWTRGCYYTPGNGYNTSKPCRGWLNIAVRLLPHITLSRTEQATHIDFTLTQIPTRGCPEGESWAIGFAASRYEDEWEFTKFIGSW